MKKIRGLVRQRKPFTNQTMVWSNFIFKIYFIFIYYINKHTHTHTHTHTYIYIYNTYTLIFAGFTGLWKKWSHVNHNYSDSPGWWPHLHNGSTFLLSLPQFSLSGLRGVSHLVGPRALKFSLWPLGFHHVQRGTRTVPALTLAAGASERSATDACVTLLHTLALVLCRVAQMHSAKKEEDEQGLFHRAELWFWAGWGPVAMPAVTPASFSTCWLTPCPHASSTNLIALSTPRWAHGGPQAHPSQSVPHKRESTCTCMRVLLKQCKLEFKILMVIIPEWQDQGA